MIYADALKQAKKEAEKAEANYVLHPASIQCRKEMDAALHRLKRLQQGDYGDVPDLQDTTEGRPI